MEQPYRRAIRLALGERRLWAAGLLSALAFSQAWWIIFDWGPESLGERAGNWVKGPGGQGPGGAILFILVTLISFVALRALGYLAEMVLVRQVADQQSQRVPTCGVAFASSRHRYLPFAVTLLPWDALRLMVIYLPSLIIAFWERWDPSYNHLILYLMALLLWLLIVLAVYVMAGIAAMLAARFSLLEEKGVPGAWREGWKVFRMYPGECGAILVQAAVADIIFLVLAWPLSILIPWAVGLAANHVGLAPLRWLIYLVTYTIMATGFISAQAVVQCYKSSLWTTFFLGLSWEERMDSIIHDALLGNQMGENATTEADNQENPSAGIY